MSSEMSLSPLVSASEPSSINSELGTYPPDPLPLLREGGNYGFRRGVSPFGLFLCYQMLKESFRGVKPLYIKSLPLPF